MTTDTATTPAPTPAPTPARDYTSEPQQVVLGLVDALLATWPEPQTPTSLAARTDYSRDQCYRGLKNLEVAGWVTDGPTGWTLTPHLTQASETIRQRTAQILERYLTPRGLH